MLTREVPPWIIRRYVLLPWLHGEAAMLTLLLWLRYNLLDISLVKLPSYFYICWRQTISKHILKSFKDLSSTLLRLIIISTCIICSFYKEDLLIHSFIHTLSHQSYIKCRPMSICFIVLEVIGTTIYFWLRRLQPWQLGALSGKIFESLWHASNPCFAHPNFRYWRILCGHLVFHLPRPRIS